MSNHLSRAAQARREGRLFEAREGLLEALTRYRNEGTAAELIDVLKALGQVERDLERLDAALRLYEEAAALCRTGGDPRRLAHTLRHVGDIHAEAGRPSDAETSYVEALALYRDQDDATALDLANAIRPFAILREVQGDRRRARRLWSEARDLYASVGIQAGVQECEEGLGRLDSPLAPES